MTYRGGMNQFAINLPDAGARGQLLLLQLIIARESSMVDVLGSLATLVVAGRLFVYAGVGVLQYS